MCFPFLLAVRTGDEHVVVLVGAPSAVSGSAGSPLAAPYGCESWLVFDGAYMLQRGSWPAQPQVWRIR